MGYFANDRCKRGRVRDGMRNEEGYIERRISAEYARWYVGGNTGKVASSRACSCSMQPLAFPIGPVRLLDVDLWYRYLLLLSAHCERIKWHRYPTYV